MIYENGLKNDYDLERVRAFTISSSSKTHLFDSKKARIPKSTIYIKHHKGKSPSGRLRVLVQQMKSGQMFITLPQKFASRLKIKKHDILECEMSWDGLVKYKKWSDKNG